MDHPQGVLRTGDRATVTFEFISRPEFLKEGMKLLFREGKTKVRSSFRAPWPLILFAFRVLSAIASWSVDQATRREMRDAGYEVAVVLRDVLTRYVPLGNVGSRRRHEASMILGHRAS